MFESNNPSQSVFRELYSQTEFQDKYRKFEQEPLDVIMPLFHANELLRNNIFSFYKEIPIKNFIVSIDSKESLKFADLLSSFPRVKILDHTSYSTLGYSLKKLIESVETEWFVYLHSDIFLPSGWFDITQRHKIDGDFIETNPHLAILLEFNLDQSRSPRAFSGAQMGRKVALAETVKDFDDDYLYRNEDIIIAELLEKKGYKYVKTSDVFHLHELTHHESPRKRKIQNFNINWDIELDEEVDTCLSQIKGIIKYLSPSNRYHLGAFEYTSSLRKLIELKKLDENEMEKWIINTNSDWLPFHKREIRKEKVRLFFRRIDKLLDILYAQILKIL